MLLLSAVLSVGCGGSGTPAVVPPAGDAATMDAANAAYEAEQEALSKDN
jgi:hypothetical protein